MRHANKTLIFNNHDIKIDEEIYDQVKWFNENGYITGESCQGGEKLRGGITPLYIVFIRLNKKQKRILSKICKNLNITFQTAYLYVVTYPHGWSCPVGMEISIQDEKNRVGLLNKIIAQLEYLQLNNSSNKVRGDNK